MQNKKHIGSIRAEQPEDVDHIEDLTMRAFESVVYSDHHEQFIVRALRQSGQLSISLVAELDGQLIGHVAISPVRISSGTEAWYGLGPVSVLPEFQGQGIGRDLIETALAQLKKRQAKGCVVLGEPDYYARFGFRPLSQLVLEGVPAEYFQVLAFENEIPQGNVQYHASFNATS
ncbi:GNAT family N-acetyltransferase [Acinetobacter sp. AM]|uniref:GNAT family N-acetyltransferase n=1 Tax=Acinetobacter sp. AM TaxID=2170730 RepID=UPI000DE6CCF4|nr:N-acetyltransferase [Acinetobacter sp. AM]PWB13129.1 GNAT family N-acetyltransferase [Acinetobacter sp. AM]